MCRHIEYIMTRYAAGSIVKNASRVVWMPITSTQHLDAFVRHGRESLLRQKIRAGETRSRQNEDNWHHVIFLLLHGWCSWLDGG